MSETGVLLQRFLQGHPTVFGALLLMIGLFQSAFGVILFLSPCAYRDELGTHFSSAAVLILAGILTLAVDKAKSLNLKVAKGDQVTPGHCNDPKYELVAKQLTFDDMIIGVPQEP